MPAGPDSPFMTHPAAGGNNAVVAAAAFLLLPHDVPPSKAAGADGAKQRREDRRARDAGEDGPRNRHRVWQEGWLGSAEGSDVDILIYRSSEFRYRLNIDHFCRPSILWTFKNWFPFFLMNQ